MRMMMMMMCAYSCLSRVKGAKPTFPMACQKSITDAVEWVQDGCYKGLGRDCPCRPAEQTQFPSLSLPGGSTWHFILFLLVPASDALARYSTLFTTLTPTYCDYTRTSRCIPTRPTVIRSRFRPEHVTLHSLITYLATSTYGTRDYRYLSCSQT